MNCVSNNNGFLYLTYIMYIFLLYDAGAYLGPNWVYALKGFHGAVALSLSVWRARHSCIRLKNKWKLLESWNMSQCRERSKQFVINEHYLYIFNIYLYVSSVRIQTQCRYCLKVCIPPFAFRLYYIAYLNVLQIYIFWTSIRTCVIVHA